MSKQTNEAAVSYFATLRGRLQEAGILPAELSRALGQSGQSQMSRWLAGGVGAHASTIQKVEQALQGLIAGKGLVQDAPEEIAAQAGAGEAREPTLPPEDEEFVRYLAALGDHPDRPGGPDEPPRVESAALEGGEAKPVRVNVWGRAYQAGEDGF